MKLKNTLIAVALTFCAISAQAQTIKPFFNPSKAAMSQLDFTSKIVAFSSIEFTGCYFRTSSVFLNVLGYDGITVGKELEIYSHNLSNRTIKYKDVEEHDAIIQEYMFRVAVCSMQLTLR